MGSGLSSATMETETKTQEQQTDKKPIKDQFLNQSTEKSNNEDKQKVVFEEGKEKQQSTMGSVSSSSSKTLETDSKTREEIGEKSIKNQSLQVSDQPKKESSNEKKEEEEVVVEKGEEEKEDDDEEEEEGECGFCLFMKGGGCKETFVAWEECIESVEKEKGDIVEKCFKVTEALKKCMEEHSDYYRPILQAEKAAEQEVINEFEKIKLEEEEEEENANKSAVDKEAIVEVEKDGGAASLPKDNSLVKEAVIEA
ncbi:hypothetical protein AQUCO_01100214v1 [Aquilegia coerulea]|uniref:GCK domain-containing protein n=1 Tax=Aquilegia coerulea TaxID=218851 RepID=A0A2G5E693_AQUCA|nr:hypothetical protein AQUCO_01100214v1 [Aquilegia coerulea]